MRKIFSLFLFSLFYSSGPALAFEAVDYGERACSSSTGQPVFKSGVDWRPYTGSVVLERGTTFEFPIRDRSRRPHVALLSSPNVKNTYVELFRREMKQECTGGIGLAAQRRAFNGVGADRVNKEAYIDFYRKNFNDGREGDGTKLNEFNFHFKEHPGWFSRCENTADNGDLHYHRPSSKRLAVDRTRTPNHLRAGIVDSAKAQKIIDDLGGDLEASILIPRSDNRRQKFCVFVTISVKKRTSVLVRVNEIVKRRF